MVRKGVLALLVLNVALVALNALVFMHNRATSDDGPRPGGAAWERWRALSVAERAAYIQRYHAAAQLPNARTVWQDARQFARLPPARQEALRTLQRVLREILDQESGAGRRDLLRAPPRATAFFVYQALEADDPQRVRELAKLLRSASAS